jgi:hypothetical protein
VTSEECALSMSGPSVDVARRLPYEHCVQHSTKRHHEVAHQQNGSPLSSHGGQRTRDNVLDSVDPNKAIVSIPR